MSDLTQAEVARHLALSGSREVRELRDRGVIPDPREASLDEIRERYIRHLRAVAAGRRAEPVAAPASGPEGVFAFALVSGGRIDESNQATWADLCGLFNLSDEDLRELLRWGLPFLTVGGPRSARGWSFSVPHVLRWLGLWSGYLDRLGVTSYAGEPPADATRRLAERFPDLAADAFGERVAR